MGRAAVVPLGRLRGDRLGQELAWHAARHLQLLDAVCVSSLDHPRPALARRGRRLRLRHVRWCIRVVDVQGRRGAPQPL